jgi:hypothetical protein
LHRVNPSRFEIQKYILGAKDIWIPKVVKSSNDFIYYFMPRIKILVQVGDKILKVKNVRLAL